MAKIAFYTLGCKLNQYETQILTEQFRRQGFEIVSPDEFADAYIINSCTVTSVADKKSRNCARRSKRLNPAALTALIGCYAEVAGESLSRIAEIDLIVGSRDKERVVSEIAQRLAAACGQSAENMAAGMPLCESGIGRRGDADVSEIAQIVGSRDKEHVVSEITQMDGRTRAYIKIEDGCDRFCSYCVIPYARGPVRSRPLDEILREAKTLISNGYKELILTGVNAALYARPESPRGLIDVVRQIAGLEGDFRIRLGSLEPTVIDAEYVRELVKCEKLCPQLHLSLQSGSDHILRAMRRRYNMEEYHRILAVLRAHDAAYSITTDIIVGFPGETEDDFEDSIRATEQAEFSHVHVFKYSKRPGTPAAKFQEQIPESEKSRRAVRLADAGEKSAKAFRSRCRGLSRRTLILEKSQESGYYKGITDNGIELLIRSEHDIANSFMDCRIE